MAKAPKKIVETPKRKYTKKKVENPVEMTITETEVENIVNYWRGVTDAKDLVIVGLENMLDEAYKEQEEMTSEIVNSLGSMLNHCSEVAKNTGSVTTDDVLYCVNLLTRTMTHKFESSSTEE